MRTRWSKIREYQTQITSVWRPYAKKVASGIRSCDCKVADIDLAEQALLLTINADQPQQRWFPLTPATLAKLKLPKGAKVAAVVTELAKVK